MAPKLIIPVGIPGCGKSTYADRFFPIVYSSDAIREELSGDATNQDINADVFGVFHRRIEHAFAILAPDDECDVFADSTNLRDFAREKLRAIADRVGVETHVILFDNNHQAVDRNNFRKRVVPADVMVRMLDQFERAKVDIYTERYDSITVIKEIS
jgi:predicted kinase